MKEDKNTLYIKKILFFLLTHDLCTVLQLAEETGMSEKTVRTKLKDTERWLKEQNLGSVEKKQGRGMWLAANENQRKHLEDELLLKKDWHMSEALDNRNNLLIGKLLKLKPGEVTTIQQLADSLYLSAPTVGTMLKEITGWFKSRDIEVTSIRNKGVCLKGDEYNFRLALKDYMLDTMPDAIEALLGTYAPGVDSGRIRKIIVEAENAWRIELADASFNMAWIMTCLSVARHRFTGESVFSNLTEDNVQYYNEYSFAETVYKRIEDACGIKIIEKDIELFTVLLLSAKKLKNFTNSHDENYAEQYDKNMGKFVKLVIETIDSVLDIDLSEDELLYDNLLLHMRSAIFRMKYSTATGDSICKYVKNEYKQTFLATWSTSSLFEEYYGVQVTEDELAGIALYIEAAIIRKKKDKPLVAIYVSQAGMARSQFFLEMIRYNIPEITEIQTVSFHDFRLSHYPNADIIITTTEMDLQDSRTVYVGNRIEEAEISAIRRKIYDVSKGDMNKQFRFNNLCHPLFEVDLILIKPKIDEKDELIKLMVKKLEEKGDVTENYLESVFEREHATTTSIGRGIAIPHGNASEINVSRIVVTILDNPISWHGDMVKVVFLLAVKMNTRFERERTKQFYKDFLELTENDYNLETLKKMNSALNVYQYFIR